MAMVESRMSFLQPWSEEKGNPYVRGAPAERYDTLNYSNLEYPVKIIDARPNKDDFNIDTHGFAYHNDPYITQEVLEILRANDKTTVAREYYPLVETLVMEKTGASKVVIFDHTLRRRDPSLAKTDNPSGREQPASLVRDFFLTESQRPRRRGFPRTNNVASGALRPVRTSDSFFDSEELFLTLSDLTSARFAAFIATSARKPTDCCGGALRLSSKPFDYQRAPRCDVDQYVIEILAYGGPFAGRLKNGRWPPWTAAL